MVTLLTGIGWFANFRLHENDKNRLQEDLEAKIQSALALVETRLNEYDAELFRKLNARLETSANRLFNELDFLRKDLVKSSEQSEARDDKLDSMIQSLKSTTDTLIKNNK